MASKAPTPATRAKLPGACLIPTSEFTFKGKLTSRGATNSRLVLMYANAYSEMKPHPTRRATTRDGIVAASTGDSGHDQSARRPPGRVHRHTAA
jgi:hypothetical protein